MHYLASRPPIITTIHLGPALEAVQRIVLAVEALQAGRRLYLFTGRLQAKKGARFAIKSAYEVEGMR